MAGSSGKLSGKKGRCMPENIAPMVSVIICTRGRTEILERAVSSVIKSNYPRFELILIDQNRDDRIERILGTLLKDQRIRHIKSATQGVGTARNIGMRNTQGEIVAFTDDDCEVMSDWINELVRAFQSDQKVGVVLGKVLAGPHDSNTGFIPAYFPKAPFLACSIREKHKVEGIGACMGIRKTTWTALRGFDEYMGSGAPLKSGEDTDFIVRTLLSGYYVYETPEVAVVHHSFRTWEESQQLIKNYMYGFGAMFVKHFKSGHWQILVVLFHLAQRWAFSEPVVYLGKRPPRLMRLASFIKGAVAGALTPVNRDAAHYYSRKADPQ
jgi:glycosyltransferase involved in cell wall biosynthesis